MRQSSGGCVRGAKSPPRVQSNRILKLFLKVSKSAQRGEKTFSTRWGSISDRPVPRSGLKREKSGAYQQMRTVKVSAIQMSCTSTVAENLAAAERLVRRAAGEGAQIVLLPELFERPYFCQERRYEYYAYAKPTLENDAVRHFLPISKELSLVLPISFYERSGNVLYNSVAVLHCGVLLGVYRKTHIPDDHYYQEKFYFTPGDTGFRVWNTTYGKVGVGICWDQWVTETARCLALGGAELLFYPPAIGSEPILDVDSMPHWQRTMQGHAAANVVPVIAANRFGLETV